MKRVTEYLIDLLKLTIMIEEHESDTLAAEKIRDRLSELSAEFTPHEANSISAISEVIFAMQAKRNVRGVSERSSLRDWVNGVMLHIQGRIEGLTKETIDDEHQAEIADSRIEELKNLHILLGYVMNNAPVLTPNRFSPRDNGKYLVLSYAWFGAEEDKPSRPEWFIMTWDGISWKMDGRCSGSGHVENFEHVRWTNLPAF